MDDIDELFRGVAQGNARGIAEMLRYRPELSRAVNEDGVSILTFARYVDRWAVLRELIEAGPPLDIFEAASLDRADDVRALIEADPAQSRAYDARGMTALHVAARHGCGDVARLLIERGAGIEARARNARAATPLHIATAAAQHDVARILLRAGADPDARDGDGATPLIIAAAAGDRTLVEMLIARNANVDVRDSHGRSAAAVAARRGHVELAARIHLGERVIDRSTA